ncbi:MAG TPA: BatA domain-containing protein [Gemmataceae bacterium]|nr:BatA domain-containing protein [Gemmataceae bacterium]
MQALFLNPGFLLIAVILISVPIIIHLINRMRFKRIRWAAMEFLLKAQKRTRRRLIIEQLLLLALRCLLVGLVGLLVVQFVGCGDTEIGKPNLHLVLLDDTVSMQDQWTQDGVKKSAFDVAKNDILIKKITKGLSLTKTSDQLVLLPLSRVGEDGYDGELFEKLNDPDKLKEANLFISELQPTMMHVNMLQAFAKAKAKMASYPESQVTLHVLSDFRHVDWSSARAEAVMKELNGLVQSQKGIKIRLIDTVQPVRAANQGGFPPSSDNIGIVDFRPSTRIIGSNMPVQFTVAIKNFSSKQMEVHLAARNENMGKEMLDVNFNPQNPIKLMPSSITNVSFEQRFIPDKANETYFAHVSVRLENAAKQALGNDGLLADNTRHAVVEVRDKVPILVVDGDGAKGREESKDSFFIQRSLISVPGSSYQVVFADELPGTGNNPLKALERPDLNKYPTIFMLNVGPMSPKQVANLENYVKEGGGVAFYMGPNANGNGKWYTDKLYRDGKGVFPAPLREFCYPPLTEKELTPNDTGDTYQLLIRDEKFPEASKTPIFGMMFQEPKHKDPLRFLPIRRYFKINEGQWKPDPGRVFELATLPNDSQAINFSQDVATMTVQPATSYKAILENKELVKYRDTLKSYVTKIETLVKPGSEAKAYQVAQQIDALFNDKGAVNMTDFWANGDPDVQTLRRDLKNLRERVNYGDPFIITQNFGKGKVVAVLSTAGKDWNDWGGGSGAQVLYPMFIWELQNYLSSQGSEANLAVGQDIDLALDAELFRNVKLKLVRDFRKPSEDKPAASVKVSETVPNEHDGLLHFKMTKNTQPGVYISRLVDDNAPDKTLAVYAHAFNVDTEREGDLQRVGSDEIDRDLDIRPGNNQVKFGGIGMDDRELVGRVNNLSESPWLFLLFLIVLVAEQALAVHLSFHTREGDDNLAPAGSGGSKGTV